jgi:hypothetical protein
MNTPAPGPLTIGMGYPWLSMTLDQTDKIVTIIPEDKLDWRLSDPSGKWHFSLAEIAMHCADARRLFARMLSGSDRTDDYRSPGPGENGVWPFHAYESKQAILDDLSAARAELQPWLDRPTSSATEITASTRAAWEKNLSRLKEAGTDTAVDELRGPASILRVLMAATVHEAGHRSSLQTLLRMHGVNLE